MLPFSKVLLALLVFSAVNNATAQCTNKVLNCDTSKDYFDTKISFDYAATVQSIEYKKTYVVVKQDWNAWSGKHNQALVFVRCGCPAPDNTQIPAGAKVFFVPISKIMTQETVAVQKIYLIGQRAKMFAVDSFRFVTTPELRDDVSTGVVQDIAGNYSKLTAMPDVFYTGSGNRTETGWNRATMEPLRILDSDPSETSPLGRAELIKLTALMCGAEDAGNTIFSLITSRYNEARLAANRAVRRRPFIVLNTPTPGWGWSATRGSSYVGNFMRDAGALYRNFDDSINTALNNGATTDVRMNVAQAETYFASADYWVNAYWQQPDLGRFSMDRMINGNRSGTAKGDRDAFSRFQSFQCSRVLANSNALQPNLAGNPYFELGVVRPDLILLDLVYFLHPYLRRESALFENYKPTFYFQMPPLTDSTGVPPCPISQLPVTPDASSVLLMRSFLVQGAPLFDFRDALYPTIADRVATALDKARAQIDFNILNVTMSPQSFVLEIVLLSNQCDACPGASSTVRCDVVAARRLDTFAATLQSILVDANANTLSKSSVRPLSAPGVLKCSTEVTIPFADVGGFSAGLAAKSEDGKLSSGAIVGIAIGGFVFVVLLILGTCLSYKIGQRRGHDMALLTKTAQGAEPTNSELTQRTE